MQAPSFNSKFTQKDNSAVLNHPCHFLIPYDWTFMILYGAFASFLNALVPIFAIVLKKKQKNILL